MPFSEPEKIINTLELKDGMQVADIGAGSGFYSLAAAKAVAPSGKVFSIDIQKELLDRLKDESERQNTPNVTTVWGNAENADGTRLRPDSIDLVIIANTLFQIENKIATIKEISRILKTGGRVLVVDWSDSHGGLGPKSDQVLFADSAQKLFEDEGFTLDVSLPCGEHHYGLVLSI